MPGTYQYDVEIKSNVAKLLSDMKQVQDRLDTVEGKEYKIKLNVDEKKLSNVISNLEKMLDSLGKGTGDFKQFENLSKELSSIVSEVQSLSKAFGKVDDSGAKTLLSSIQNIDKSLSELSQNILHVNKNMSNMGGNTSGAVKQVENISNAYQVAAKEAEKLADAQSKIGQKTNISSASTESVTNSIKEENNVLEQNTQKIKENTQAKEQNANVNLNKYDKRLDSYNGKIDKYKTTIDRFNDGGWTSNTYLENVQAVKNAVHEYETLLNELKGKDASLVTNDDISKLDEYEKKIKDTIATVTNMSASEKGYNFVSGQKELDKIHKLLNENSKMSAEAKAKIKAYYREIESGNPSMSLDRIHGEIMKIYNAEVEAGRAGKSLWDTFKTSRLHQIVAQAAGMFGFYDIINIGKQAVEVVTELDSAFTEMRKVSDETEQSLKRYQQTTFTTADAIGTTAVQIQKSTANWQRLGYSLDEASKLAENSNIYKNVGDMDINEATEHMISSVQAWKSEFGDAVTASEEIMNRYNKIGNEFAISSADIGEAMETSAAALKAGGNDLNESIGLITAGNLIQQDASTTASAMKILSLRIRGAKADLDDMGESTDDLSDSTSKMREELKALTGVDIMKDENTFKSTAEIIQEMGKNWDKLTDVSKAAALEKLAGKNRASTVSGLIENYETIGEVIEAAENSENSALEENEKYLESIEGRTQKLTNQLQELASVSIKDDWIKDGISGLTTLLDLVTKLVDKFGIIPTVAPAIAAALSFKNVG